MWICEVQLVLITESDLLNEDVESFFAFQDMYAADVYGDEFSKNLSFKDLKIFFTGTVYMITCGTKTIVFNAVCSINYICTLS
jgi:hypothetical protein